VPVTAGKIFINSWASHDIAALAKYASLISSFLRASDIDGRVLGLLSSHWATDMKDVTRACAALYWVNSRGLDDLNAVTGVLVPCLESYHAPQRAAPSEPIWNLEALRDAIKARMAGARAAMRGGQSIRTSLFSQHRDRCILFFQAHSLEWSGLSRSCRLLDLENDDWEDFVKAESCERRLP
jgi:hypothetical protein